jgi:mono/diheme cytochrome c family protein
MKIGRIALRSALAALCLLQGGTALAQAQKAAPPEQQTARASAPVFDKAFLSNKKNIASGKNVWESQCRHCHGAAAYPGKAPKLNPGQLAPDFIYERVTFGFGKMPAWKDVFSDEQRRSVVAYIKSRDFSP